MTPGAPPIDSRTAVEIERQVVALMKTYTPEWTEFDPATGLATGVSAGLVGVFARFAELTLQRLNRAPEKNELAFLNLLGASTLPAQPARAPLTFSLAPGARGATAPARTQAATAPGPGASKPIVFETLRELSLTPMTLAKVITWDAAADARSDHTAAADPLNTAPMTLFSSDAAPEHAIYLGDDNLLGYPTISGLVMAIDLNIELTAPVDPRVVQWEIWDGKSGSPLPLVSTDGAPADTTLSLTTSGRVSFGDIAQVPRATVNGITSRWLRCRLLTPVTASATPVAGFVRAAQTPTLGGAYLQGVGRSPRVLPDAAFLNGAPLDVSRDFFPFGPTPQFGATLYLASRDVLSQTGRRIGLSLTLSDPASGIPHPGASPALTFLWEYWTGGGWTPIGSATSAASTPANTSYFNDASKVFTASGDVNFVLQTPAQLTVVNGLENYWLRVRLIAGYFTPMPGGVAPAAPSIASAQLYYDSTNAALGVEAAYPLLREDAFGFTTLLANAGAAAAPAFAPAPDAGKSLYLGLAATGVTGAPPQTPISIWADLAPLPAGSKPDQPQASASPGLAWSYWDGAAWSPLVVADDTGALTVSGEIRFIPPTDFTAADLFKTTGLYWVRATWIKGDYKFLPRLRRLLLNTTLGEQAVTVSSEKLGSSNGGANQTYTASQAPIFEGVELHVIEPELPPQSEQAAILAGFDPSAITVLPTGGVRVRWREVGDFYGSSPRDRHFILDHQTGAILFGDGAAGLIPPRGSGNLILTRYRTGSGAQGNAPGGGVTQLKTTLPYVSAVTNVVEAAGGVDAETLDDMRARAPRLVRHGGRAVTIEDFQDLSRLASPEVAHSLCVPLLDLSIDPDGRAPTAGVVSVIIVPRSSAAAPSPSVDLVERVTTYLAARALASVSVVVVAPEYVTVDVHVQVALARMEGAADVEAAIQASLASFLHPLTGGMDGAGWDFGRRPHTSDLYRLLQDLDGVDHLRGLEVIETPERAGAIETGRFLVCSGLHRITLSYGIP